MLKLWLSSRLADVAVTWHNSKGSKNLLLLELKFTEANYGILCLRWLGLRLNFTTILERKDPMVGSIASLEKGWRSRKRK